MTRRLWTLFKAQLLLSLLLFLFSIYAFVRFASGQGDDFSTLAREQYLGTILWYQLRVLPAYLVLALSATALCWPWFAERPSLRAWASPRDQRPAGWHRVRLLLGLVAADLLFALLSLGIFSQINPGLLDGLARKSATRQPSFDWYLFARWHLLDGLAVLFGLAALYSLWRFARDGLAWYRAAPSGGRAAALLTPTLAILGLASWPLWPQPTPQLGADTPPNVLIIASDSWRADRLGVHGYARPDITPHIDAFAGQAVDFTELHVATASTLESWMSTLSSRFPPGHGVRYMYLRKEQALAAAQQPDLLPNVMHDLGYYTAVVSDWAGNCFKLVDMGFRHNDASDTQNFTSFIMESTVWAHFVFPLYFSNRFGEFLLPEVARTTKYLRPRGLIDRMWQHVDEAGRQKKPFFGLLFFSTTHLPYSASYPYNQRYTDPDYRGPHRYEIEVSVHDLITTGFSPDLSDETIEHIRALYDGAVHEFDSYVGEVLAGLKARGLDERTVVIITSDHGEDLYDEGSTLGHGTNFFGGDQSTRIPFLLRLPGGQHAGREVSGVARNIDIAPTLLSLLGHEIPDSWGGTDLSPMIRGERADLDLPVFAETCYLFFPKREAMQALSPEERARLLDASGAKDTLEIDKGFDDNLVMKADFHELALATKDRMVRTRRYKLLDIPVAEGPPIRRLWDLQADPLQREDLSGTNPEVYGRLVRLLEAYDRGEGEAQRWPAAWDEPPRSEGHPPQDLPE